MATVRADLALSAGPWTRRSGRPTSNVFIRWVGCIFIPSVARRRACCVFLFVIPPISTRRTVQREVIMRGTSRIAPVTVLVLAVSTASGFVVAQSASDVSLRAAANAPHCDYEDGELFLGNSSSTYKYRVSVNLRIAVDGDGPQECGGTCSAEACECTVSARYIAHQNDDHEFKSSCQYPTEGTGCSSSCSNCDNASEDCPQQQGAPTHCGCAYGSYQVTQYSTDGVLWTTFDPLPSAVEITEAHLERPSHCPSPANCHYD